MGGERLKDYWAAEMKAVLDLYHQFERLVPAESGSGAAHPAEDGRYVESILKNMLRKFLPSGLEVLTGFILRAGVKSDYSGKKRRKEKDINSTQLDIIIYDSLNYPVYQKIGDTAVVLPEGVIGIISVKKTLRREEIKHEIQMLKYAGMLCASNEKKGPFLALVGMDDDIGKKATTCFKNVMQDVEEVFCTKPICYDEMPGFVGNLKKWTIHKTRKKNTPYAEYQLYSHEKQEEYIGLQYLLMGILNTFYCNNYANGKRPGFVCMPSGKGFDANRKNILYDSEHSVYRNLD